MANLTTGSVQIGGAVNVQAKSLAPGSTGNVTGVVAQPSITQAGGNTTILGFGTGTGNFSQLIYQARQLAPATGENITISSGLVDVMNNANVGFTTVRAWSVDLTGNANQANGATSITVGNATNPFGGWWGANATTFTIDGGGVPLVQGSPIGRTVTAGVNDQIRILNNDAANTATYIICLAGQ